MSIEIFRPGTQVMLGKVEATIAQIAIGDNDKVRYECIWWDGYTRRDEWVEEFEVGGYEKDKVRIGFK